MDAAELIDEILGTAKAQSGLGSAALLKRAGLHQSGISRIRATGDCRFSTLVKLLEAGQLKPVVVKDERNAELLLRGELF